ncbi:MAG: hypothetical protein KF905_02260 [Flavobacteriales bacterium]|nr:hypothetical protein [Flavobacteriales bacterium]
MRSFHTLIALCLLGPLAAQELDSVHVYERVAEGNYNSAEANALAWRLHQQDAPHRTVKGSDMEVVGSILNEYSPQRHTYGPLPQLSHVAMAFKGGRPVAFAVADDLGFVINLTARKEYRISTWSEHLTVRALLSRLLVE